MGVLETHRLDALLIYSVRSSWGRTGKTLFLYILIDYEGPCRLYDGVMFLAVVLGVCGIRARIQNTYGIGRSYYKLNLCHILLL